jgi:biopolymer transport protein TolR
MALRLEMRRGRYRGRHKPMSEINVTPMVDVMLVLLVIFMVTAPLLTVGVQVDLPRAKTPALSGSDEPLAITLDARGRIFLMETEVGADDLVAKLQAISKGNTERRVFVRGDQSINYGRVIEVMGLINAAGYTKVSLVARDTGAPSRPRPANPAKPAR